jgi:ubiquinone/menaquinone biosynthesis C-methylase UbiE
MKKDKSKDTEAIKKNWDEHAQGYDEYYQDFNGAVEHYVDWELLKGHLPENKNAKILDAAGGTGRITLPLVKLGYSVTLCDISPAMLNVARQKLKKEGFLDKVEILECDVRKLPFPDESFDFVLCWDGTMEAAGELIRVTKKGGKISIFLVNKYGAAISKFNDDPDSAITLLKSKTSFIEDEEEKHLAISPEESEEYFKKQGIKVLGIYAVCGMQEFLSIPEEILKSKSWDGKFFKQTTEMLLRLSKESSVKGITRHLVLYGEKI